MVGWSDSRCHRSASRPSADSEDRDLNTIHLSTAFGLNETLGAKDRSSESMPGNLGVRAAPANLIPRLGSPAHRDLQNPDGARRHDEIRHSI